MFDEKLKVAVNAQAGQHSPGSFPSRDPKSHSDKLILALCCIASNIQRWWLSCGLPVIGYFSILTTVRLSLAGHRVDGGKDERERERKRGDIYASFLLRFSPREQNGNNMSPGREGNLVAGGRGEKGEEREGGLHEVLVGSPTGGT